MKRLYFVGTLFCLIGVARSSEIDVDLLSRGAESRARSIARRMAEPEEARFQRDSDSWKCYSRFRDDRYNNYDLSIIVKKLCDEVEGDPPAKRVMETFLASTYWEFVDDCAEHLSSMTPLNQRKFRSVLILLTPGLESTRYMARAVNIIGRDQRDVRATDIDEDVPFCLDMFFQAAVRNGHLGRWELALMFVEAFYAPCLKRDKDGHIYADERATVRDVEEAAYRWECFEDCPIGYSLEGIWPNWLNPIPEAVVPTELD
ncbi:MAG: hypothetical protein LBJ92_04630 [Holosporales bacterium]|jgi:hypothetical protein|nr:hypothetical protein [Holosporales bacterium]